MKNFALMLALATAPAALVACSGDEDEPKESGDGDGDGDAPICSDEEFDASEAGGGAGGGGAGGAPAAMCDMPEAPAEEIAIAGSYTDQYDGTHDISATVWDSGYTQFTLSLVNNEAGYAVARNSETDAFNACLWSLFVWTETDDGLYYCQATFGASSECGAQAADMPDAENIESGCGGFPWTELNPN